MTWIKIFRNLRRKSQFELSLATRIPSYRLSRLENGLVDPTEEELERLAIALDTSPEMLKKEISEETLASIA